MGIKLGAPNLMEHARLVRSWLWRWEDNTTFAPGAMTSDPILGEDIRGALFWDQGGTGEADALMAAAKNSSDAMAYAEFLAVRPDMLTIDDSALTARRTLTLPDGDVYLSAGGMLPVFNAKDYGVITEEEGGTSHIAARDFLLMVGAAGGGIAYFPEGTYTTGSFLLDSHMHIVGDGIGRTIFKRSAGAANQMFNGAGYATDASFSHCTLDGNSANDGTGNGMNLTGNVRFHFHDMEFKNITGYGIGTATDAEFTPIEHCLFERLWFHDIANPDNGWSGDGFDGKVCKSSTWRDIVLEDIQNRGLDIRGSHCTVDNVRAFRCGTGLRETDDVGGVGIGVANHFRNDPANFISATNPYGFNQVSNCWAVDCAGGGFMFHHESYGTYDSEIWTGEEIVFRLHASNLYAFSNGRDGIQCNGAFATTDAIAQFSNCAAVDNERYGFHLNVTQQAGVNYALTNCWGKRNASGDFYDAGGPGANGATYSACQSEDSGADGFKTLTPFSTYHGCKVFAPTGDGFDLGANARNCQVMDGLILDVASGQYGVRVAGQSQLVRDTTISGVGTGIRLEGSADKAHIFDNDLSAVTSKVSDNGATNTRYRTNEGYRTEHRLTTSVADGGTIAHGLVAAPVTYGAQATVAGEIVSITGADATNLTVAIKDNDGTAGTTQPISWWADTQQQSAAAWTPREFGEALELWMRGHTINPLADTDPVISWPDDSGHGRNGSNETGVTHPTYAESAINGLAAVAFDQSLSQLLTVGGMYSTTDQLTFLIVAQDTTAALGSILGANQFSIRATGDNAEMRRNTNQVYSTGGLSGSAWHVHLVYFNGASSWGSLDGTRSGTLNPGAESNGATLRIGTAGAAGPFFDGEIAEIICVSGALSDADAYRLEGYAAWKYGLEANLPGGHAYVSAAPTI